MHSDAHDSSTEDIPDHIQRYVDQRLAEHEMLAEMLPPVGSVIPWLPTGWSTFTDLYLELVFRLGSSCRVAAV